MREDYKIWNFKNSSQGLVFDAKTSGFLFRIAWIARVRHFQSCLAFSMSAHMLGCLVELLVRVSLCLALQDSLASANLGS